MAKKLNNIKVAFRDTKTRILLLVAIIIVVIGLVVGWLGIKRAEKKGVPAAVELRGAPSGIQSIPGVGTASREYIKTQEQENILRAERAAKEGTSAIPTITRTTYIGPSEFAAPTIPLAGPAKSSECAPEALARARAAGVKAEELRCKGCNAAELRAAGYTAGELMNAGFSANELKAAGFNAEELRAAGFTAAELARAGFSPTELAAAGFNAAELSQAGVNPAAAGLSPSQIAAAGIGIPLNPNLPRDCSVEALAKARAQGVTAAELRRKGCGAAALRAAGYTAKELKDAGFSAKELKDAGFTAAQLKKAGYSAGELRQAGFNAAELKDAGFSAGDLREAGFGADELAKAGFTADQLRAAGFSNGELFRAGVTQTAPAPPSIATALSAVSVPPKDCSIETLTKARNRGVSASELRKLGCGATALRAAGYSAEELANAGFSADALRAAGYSNDELNQIGLGAAPPPESTTLVNVPSITGEDTHLDALERLQQRQAEQLSAQERQDRINQLQQTMSQQAGELIASWVPPPSQRYVVGKELEAVTVDGVNGKGGVSSAGSTATGAAASPPIIKAGTIMFAVLNTSLNSDEPSPIMATIVSCPNALPEASLCTSGDASCLSNPGLFMKCPYMNAQLVGKFQRVDQKVVLNFDTMNIQGLPQSVTGINAVAIDPETARTALADNVNNHYLLRYGSLFASSFIRDYAKAIEESGSTTTISLNGITTTNQEFSPAEKIAIGVGGVGRQVATSLGGLFTRPPTVKVEQGKGIGILFLTDVAINQPGAPAVAAVPATTAATVAPPIPPVNFGPPSTGGQTVAVPATPVAAPVLR